MSSIPFSPEHMQREIAKLTAERDDALRIAQLYKRKADALDGLSDDALDGGWNYRDMDKYAKSLEIQVAALTRGEDGRIRASVADWEREIDGKPVRP